MKLLDLILEDVKIPFPNRKTIKIENDLGNMITVNCEIPKTEEEKSTGLMYRDSLCKNCGVFYDYVGSGFWMKNVKFPIEMIFINDDTIVDIVRALPNDETIITPSVASNGNLEVNDGFCQSNNIDIGNKIYKS
jgi:uncharacterized membrane protein (UPF0127 family)